MVRRVASGPRGHEEGKARLRATAERLQSVRRATASEAAERTAELIRIDGEETTTYVLAKRTCIGRAPDCELQIDSGSVSRHHAVVIVGPRSTVIEDLNSTNGVRVNGRKVMRHVLGDGDALTIGDTQFRYFARMQEAPLGDSLAELAHTPSPIP
jgi:pSer/pThr/pTyr-binding forkhead associated (FHA) protein